MKIIVAGASGFLGTALRRQLADAGHAVVQLVRSSVESADQSHWDPARGELDPTALDGADTVINLGGAPIAHWPWTDSYKQQILDSRLETTGTIARSIAQLEQQPALVNASGINYYGDQGDREVDEDSPAGDEFLADVSRRWEDATQPAVDAGSRVVTMRTGVVLARSGGALKTIMIPFRLGLGGKLGDGRQFFPTISLPDYLGVVTRLATDSSMRGPYNVVAPVPSTNEEFTQALGKHLHRPTVIPVPRFAVEAAAGELSTLVFVSVHAVPRRLVEAGFEFQHPTIDEQLAAALQS
ncbi:MAG: TIGR01777 family oxidoreductase [Actinomycetota bacterium]|nr:TIGR01777 family oxidoreductase [Actinomycetota bacterium]